jgi:hypothetical protein
MDEKLFKPIQGITEKLNAMYVKFVREHGCQPSGFIIGPNEMISLAYELDRKLGSKQTHIEVRYLNGLPVIMKRSNGCELAIPGHLSHHFAIGEVRPEPSEQD